jgi:DNA-binding beta-propeller fold protein YncE
MRRKLPLAAAAIALCCLLASLAAIATAGPLATAEAKRTAYVAGADSGTVAAFDVGPGGLSAPIPGSPFSIGAQATGVSIAPDGRRLFAANDNTVSGRSIAPDGSLASLPGSPYAAGALPGGTAISPDGARLYVANYFGASISGYSIGSNGIRTPLPGSPYMTGGFSAAVAVSPDGRHAYVTRSDDASVIAYAVAADGSLSVAPGSPFPAGDNPLGIVVSPDGHVFALNLAGASVSAYAPNADGSLTQVPGSPFPTGDSPTGAVVTPDGRRLYVTNQSSGNISGYGIAGDGTLSPLPGTPFAVPSEARAAAASPDGTRLFVASGDSDVVTYAIGADGMLTQLGSPLPTGVTGARFQSVAVTPNQGPVAGLAAAGGSVGTPVGLDARASSDPDGSVARYDWDFGDGTELADGGPTPSHVYTTGGAHTATVTVTDDEGCSTVVVFTGQTASCNGSAAATATAPVTVVGTAAPPKAQATVRIVGKRLRLDRRRRTRVRLACSAARCTGRLVLRTARRLRTGGRLAPRSQAAGRPRTAAQRRRSPKRRVTLASRRFSIPAGRSRPVRVKLRRGAARLVRANRAARRVRVTARLDGRPAPSATATKAMRIARPAVPARDGID